MENSEYKTKVVSYFKDGTKRVIVCEGRRDYEFAKALVVDVEGRSEHILKVETHIL